jgi:hypothetical protein
MSDRLIFICYNEKDKKWKQLLEEQLGVLEQDGLEVFSDTNIETGEDRIQKIEEALRRACVAVLLVSAGSLNPKLILSEERKTLLTLRDQQGLRIFPIIVRSCLWEKVEWLSRLGVRPRDKKPLEEKSAAKTNRELTDIVAEIAKIVAATTGLDSQPAAVQPETPDRVSKADTSATAPVESSRNVQNLKAKRAKYLEKISELDRQIESSSSQTSSTGVDANLPASFGEGLGENISPQTTGS